MCGTRSQWKNICFLQQFFSWRICVDPREESSFASVPIVLGLVGQANDFCLCFEKRSQMVHVAM